jgi:hypothetical protein
MRRRVARNRCDGEIRDVVLHGTGRKTPACRPDANIRLGVFATSVLVPAWRLGQVPAARRTRTSQMIGKDHAYGHRHAFRPRSRDARARTGS